MLFLDATVLNAGKNKDVFCIGIGQIVIRKGFQIWFLHSFLVSKLSAKELVE